MTTMTELKTECCPYCNQPMKKWSPPPDSSWGDHWQWVCFNDECEYFRNGWKWMKDRYNVRASYRHRKHPITGETGPLPVWSLTALRADIIDEE